MREFKSGWLCHHASVYIGRSYDRGRDSLRRRAKKGTKNLWLL